MSTSSGGLLLPLLLLLPSFQCYNDVRLTTESAQIIISKL